MGDLYRAVQVLWFPLQRLSDAARRPFIAAPLLVLTAAATLSAVIVYLRFTPGDATLRNIWLVGLAFAAAGPALIAVAVSLCVFAAFSVLGRGGGYPAFLSVAALGLMPLACQRLLQAGVLLAINPAQAPSSGTARFNLALLMEPGAAPPQVYVAAGMIDLFSAWVLALLIVGFGHVGSRPSYPVSAAVVIGGWLIYAGLRIALAPSLAF